MSMLQSNFRIGFGVMHSSGDCCGFKNQTAPLNLRLTQVAVCGELASLGTYEGGWGMCVTGWGRFARPIASAGCETRA
jgi:hypothetical protein